MGAGYSSGQLVLVIGGRLEPLALDRAHAAVPAQDRVDVARRPQRLGALVPLHRVAEAVVGRRAHDVLAVQERAGLALVDQAAVVGALVLVGQLDDVGACLARRGGRTVGAELIGERQDEATQGVLVVGVDDEDVVADALGLRRVVEQPVALGLLHRVGDAVGVDPLELEAAHGPSHRTDGGLGHAGPLSRAAVTAGAGAVSPASSARVRVRLRIPNSLRPMIATGS